MPCRSRHTKLGDDTRPWHPKGIEKQRRSGQSPGSRWRCCALKPDVCLHLCNRLQAQFDSKLTSCRLLTSEAASASPGSSRGRLSSQVVRQHCSEAAQQSASHAVHGLIQTATASLRSSTSGACMPLWLPSALQPGRHAGSFATGMLQNRQLHQAAWLSRGVVGRQTAAAAGGRQLTLMLRQRQYSTTAQLATSAAAWRSAARRIAFKRLQVIVSIAIANRLLSC